MTSSNYFIAGTDTDVGKTLVTAALLLRARKSGVNAIAMKPVAAGAQQTDEGLRNSDAELLIQYASRPLAYHNVNPYCYEPPIAPHIAAEIANCPLSAAELRLSVEDFLREPSQIKFIEGAGGWRVPLNNRETLADVVQAARLPVILVIGLKLGCLNHAMLTIEAIEHDGVGLAGWVGNQCQKAPMSHQEANLSYLKSQISAPCLGVLPFMEGPDPVSSAVDYISLPSVTA